MKGLTMNLQDLNTALMPVADDVSIRFQSDEGLVGPGFHITELKAAKIEAIDCGGAMDQWDEVILQLMDGHEGQPMRADRLRSILKHSIGKIPALAEAEVRVEFSHGNQGMGIHRMSNLHLGDAQAVIELTQDQAVCKANIRDEAKLAAKINRPAAQASCC